MPLEFVHDPLAVRTVFGAGRRAAVSAESSRLSIGHAMLVCSPAMAKRITDIEKALGDRLAVTFAGAEPHCPRPVVEKALWKFGRREADGVIAVGGGSTIGLGKNIAAETGAPYLVLPTTYSGSEMTAIAGMLIGDEKRTRYDPACAPKTVIYDPELTYGLPARVTATSGMNCLAHLVEALYAQNRHPLAQRIGERGIALLGRSLAKCVGSPADPEARSEALFAAMLGGMAVTLGGIALHHKLCHVLGGHYGIPHGESNAVILPHAVAYNAPAIPDALAAIGRALGVAPGESARALFDLAGRLGCPQGLGELGMPRRGIGKVVRDTLAATAYNPRPLEERALRRMLEAAHAGRPPETDL